jgi:hypothetical protein
MGSFTRQKLLTLVLFRNLLEHLYHPHQFLEAVRKCLKPNGHIVVDVPNVNALMEFGCYGLFFHQHITYFSLETLEKLLAKHGFAMTASHEGNPNLFVCASRGTSLAPRLQEAPVVKNFEEKIINQSEKIKSQIDDIFSNKENLRIGLFGASALATTLIQHIDSAAISKITHIFDSDTEKHGKKLYGCDVKITGYERAQGNLIDCIVITTYFFDAEVRSHLLCEEFPSRKIVVLHESN